MQLCSKMKKSSNVVVFLVLLLFVEGLQLCLCKNSTFGCIEREREALLQLKQSFINDSSNRLVSWTGNDCCHWNGVRCDQNTGHVVELDLRVPTYSVIDGVGHWHPVIDTSKQLSAMEVDSSLVELRRLEYLDLSGNDFNQSQIPEFLGSLKHLKYLNLSFAGFEGRIPVQLGNLTSLQILDLSPPWYFELYADSFQWASGLSSLTQLDLSSVNLSKALDLMQVLNMLPSLLELRLRGCGIQNTHFPRGFINSTFFASIQVLDLGSNELNGPIPDALKNMTALRELDLNDEGNYYFGGGLYANDLQWVSRLSSLQHLDMSGVNLRKALDLMQVLNTLPSLLELRLEGCGIQNIHFSHGFTNSTFFASIQVLDLQFNELNGPIPDALKNMTALRELDLSDEGNYNFGGGLYANDLQWVSRLSSLQHLYMNRVNLSKAIDLMHVLNMLPSLLELRLDGCGIQNIHFPRGFINSTFFASIQVLDLGSNELHGPIPDALQNLTTIRSLDLSRNYFNSTIPLRLVNSKNLVHLTLMWNEFENIEGGMLSMLNKACSLKLLYLSGNPFHGELLESNKSSSRCPVYVLEYLDLRFSGISGNLPDYLGQMKALKFLDLSSNQLNGRIPQLLGRLSILVQLDLSNNELNGIIPQSLGRLSTLEQLDLSNNQLNGIIPQSLGRLSTLEQLDLSNNQLNGSIPQSLWRLSTLERLDLSYNQLTGYVPDSLGSLVSLSRLHISSNSLQGLVSEQTFGNHPYLSILDIGSNHLSCKFKYDWVPPFSDLYYINMSFCDFGSQFPHWIQTQKNVYAVDLSNANISGGFPTWLHGMSLSYLDLSTNKISGSLPTNIADKMPSLTTLLLGNNSMDGQLPNSLCKLESLGVMDLSRNKLSGEMPRCWRDTQMFYVINLSYNMLSGTIPDLFGNLTYMKRLHLNNNNLTGELPLPLRNCKELEILDLGENNFFGSIPTWIGESLSSLQILRLSKNMLNGSIPSQLCQLNELQLLNLANNNLTGRIPRCFGKLTGMVINETLVPISNPAKRPPSPPRLEDYDTNWDKEKVREITKGVELEYTKIQLKLLDIMDLSGNKLVGTIPEELCFLTGLRGLNLSHNHLSGNIPNKIGELKLLESLDLSNNNLWGTIPPSMSALNFINHLNLSNNNLSGKIPTGNQLQTLDDQSIYAGNLQLCGKPLPNKCPGDDDSVQPPTSTTHEDKDHEEDKKEKILFYFVVIAGYATGLWGVIGTLVFKRNWRVAYFRFADDTKEWILLMAAVKVARLKKRMQRTNTEE